MILQKRFSSSGSSMISSGGDAGSCDAGAGGDNGSASRSAFAVRKGCLDGVEATDGGGAGVEEAAAAEGGESVEDDASACRPRASLDRELGLRLDRWGGSSLSSGRRPLAESVRSSTCCLCSNNASASDSSRVGAADCALGSLRGLGTPKDSHEAIVANPGRASQEVWMRSRPSDSCARSHVTAARSVRQALPADKSRDLGHEVLINVKVPRITERCLRAALARVPKSDPRSPLRGRPWRPAWLWS